MKYNGMILSYENQFVNTVEGNRSNSLYCENRTENLNTPRGKNAAVRNAEALIRPTSIQTALCWTPL